MSADPVSVIFDYHRQTKHRFEAYAPGPEALDWDAQPAPFRHFAGARFTPLPLHGEGGALAFIGSLLHLAFGLSAWKRLGPDRWALRTNPSSGNLHPVEAYVLVQGWPGLDDGLYHYRPDDHGLELRAAVTLPALPEPALAVLLTTVPWREAWKYGARAFRYCQLDVGHGEGSLAAAATLLSATLQPLALGTSDLARLTGVDRLADFPGGKRSRPDTEGEEAEAAYTVVMDGLRPLDPTPWLAALASADAAWSGPASTIDAHPLYRWPQVTAAQVASRRQTTPASPPQTTATTAPTRRPGQVYSSHLILGRRSAQRYRPGETLAAGVFQRLLEATQVDDNSVWTGFAGAPRLDLLLFVHRVEGLTPGVYLYPRCGGSAGTDLGTALAGRQTLIPVPQIAGLQQLQTCEPVTLHRIARSLHCHQDMAANAAFSLGMIAEFATPLTADPHHYRLLLREAGRLGQALYLEAEAQGVRGCGIGCFFDDPVHQVLGLEDETWQTVYHFTVGNPVIDTRIETEPAYAHLPPRHERLP